VARTEKSVGHIASFLTDSERLTCFTLFLIQFSSMMALARIAVALGQQFHARSRSFAENIAYAAVQQGVD
jgi:hypothetical protein